MAIPSDREDGVLSRVSRRQLSNAGSISVMVLPQEDLRITESKGSRLCYLTGRHFDSVGRAWWYYREGVRSP
jgi:hypothetical protein